MLHWLSGQRQTGHDNTSHAEPPETPAPLFAVRAFKHAIFGTPATIAPIRHRRNSNLDKDTGVSIRPTRPVLTRPKSANDAVMAARIEDFPASPTKGILLTPGTVGRGKTVTFGDHIMDRDSRKNEQVGSIKTLEISRKRTGLFDDLEVEDGHDENPQGGTHRKQTARPPPCCKDELNHEELATIADKEPECAVGRYWKREYDIYRENTQREVRKLVTKQKAAKSYAREKDEQCSALSEELQKERQTVGQLGKRALELEAFMKELQAQLAALKTTSTLQSPVEDCTPSERVVRRLHAAGDALARVTTRPGQQEPETGTTVAKRRRPRHDSLDPDVPAVPTHKQLGLQEPMSRMHHPAAPAIGPKNAVEEDKENSHPSTQISMAASSLTVESHKTVVSREGEVIPPDRVAAARARLAARRQQRIAT